MKYRINREMKENYSSWKKVFFIVKILQNNVTCFFICNTFITNIRLRKSWTFLKSIIATKPILQQQKAVLTHLPYTIPPFLQKSWGGGSHNARGFSTFLIYIPLLLSISSSSSSPHDTFLSSWLKSSVPWCWNTLQQKSVSRAQWVRESCEGWHCFNPFLLPRRMDRDNITHNHKILITAQAQKINHHRY